MILLFKSILTISCLLLIAVQDFRDRAVSWWLFPLLFIFGFFYSFQDQGLQTVLYNIMLNALYIFFTGGVVMLYFKMKEGHSVPIIGSKIGLGDIIFFVAVTPFFDFFSFAAFIILSSLLSLVLHFLIRKNHLYGNNQHIPLAGIQSFFLLLLSVTDNLNFYMYNFCKGLC
jgi:hypothetical protein